MPRRSYGQRSLVGYSSWGCKDSDTTEATLHAFYNIALSSVVTFKITIIGTSLVVQGLRLHAPNAGDLVSIPGRGTRSCIVQLRVHMTQLNILQTKEPTCHNNEDPTCHNQEPVQPKQINKNI